MNRCEVPWPLVMSATGTIPNVPSPEGRELGANIARMVGKIDCCHDCACLLGTEPNGCAATGMDFIKCVMEGVPFMCHVNADTPCAGYVAARRQLAESEKAEQ